MAAESLEGYHQKISMACCKPDQDTGLFLISDAPRSLGSGNASSFISQITTNTEKFGVWYKRKYFQGHKFDITNRSCTI